MASQPRKATDRLRKHGRMTGLHSIGYGDGGNAHHHRLARGSFKRHFEKPTSMYKMSDPMPHCLLCQDYAISQADPKRRACSQPRPHSTSARGHGQPTAGIAGGHAPLVPPTRPLPVNNPSEWGGRKTLGFLGNSRVADEGGVGGLPCFGRSSGPSLSTRSKHPRPHASCGEANDHLCE